MSDFSDTRLPLLSGKTVKKVEEDENSLTITFTDGMVLSIVARGTEEQWLGIDICN